MDSNKRRIAESILHILYIIFGILALNEWKSHPILCSLIGVPVFVHIGYLYKYLQGKSDTNDLRKYAHSASFAVESTACILVIFPNTPYFGIIHIYMMIFAFMMIYIASMSESENREAIDIRAANITYKLSIFIISSSMISIFINLPNWHLIAYLSAPILFYGIASLVIAHFWLNRNYMGRLITATSLVAVLYVWGMVI